METFHKRHRHRRKWLVLTTPDLHQTSVILQLQDATGEVIAFFRPTRQTRYQIGDVYGELHFFRTAGMGTVVRL